MNKKLIVIVLLLAGCSDPDAKTDAEPAAPAPSTAPDRHLGGCILLSPTGEVPQDVYRNGPLMGTDALPPFSKALQVYGLKLAARDEVSDRFMRLVAKVVIEIFPQDPGLNLNMQRQVLANHYRYNALIPVPLGEDFGFMEENPQQWAALQERNSICDVIMQDVPTGQVMEVVEHILHYVSDIGLHYAYPEIWGISKKSALARAMAKAIAEGHYQVSTLDDIDDPEVRFRVELQEFAYWFISTAWNLQEAYGPVWEQEWNIADAQELERKLPEMYAAYQKTAAQVMRPPSLATLAEIGPTTAQERSLAQPGPN